MEWKYKVANKGKYYKLQVPQNYKVLESILE